MKRFAILLLVLVAVLMFAVPADAYQLHSFRWMYPDDIHYALEGAWPSWLVDYVGQAAKAWTYTPTPLILSRGRADIRVSTRALTAQDKDAGWGGCIAVDNGWCRSGAGRVIVFTGCVSLGSGVEACGAIPERPWFNKYIFMHEFGHAIGINHSQVRGAVMDRDACGNSSVCPKAPTGDDVAGVNDQYNYKPPSSQGSCVGLAIFKRFLEPVCN